MFGRDLSGMATVLGEPLLQRTEALFDTRESVPSPVPQPRELFTHWPRSLPQQFARVAREDFGVGNEVMQRTPDGIIIPEV